MLERRGMWVVFGLVAALGISQVRGATLKPVLGWGFDKVAEGKVVESVGGGENALTGHYRLVDGVKGKAMVMDGYTTCVMVEPEKVPELKGAFGVEAWVALGAYPWNWAPIAAQENTRSMNSNQDKICWPDDIAVNSDKAGFFFGISPQGYLGLHVGDEDNWQVYQTEKKVVLRTWMHVAVSFDAKEGVIFYMDGVKVSEAKGGAAFSQAKSEGLRIGMPHQQIEPSHPVRAFATLAAWYSLDGLLDEVKVYDGVLDAGTIKSEYDKNKPSGEPDLPKRVMPSGPKGPGTFGASYMHLKYYPEWDALWRVSSDPDIVVQFDDSPVRVVFWRGTRYSPAWVMENDMWMADQSIENFNMKDGCIEHMLDPRCRMSHVRIVENMPARVVVHWRYCPTSANQNHSQVNEVTGWEDWVDEYYTFYPDQIGVRKVIQHTDGQALWPEEVIALCQPGQRPEDVIELEAMTLANQCGDEHTYSWAEKSPVIRNKGRRELGGYIDFGDKLGEKPNILLVNLKSKFKPFQIFELECNFTTFAHEHRKDVSRFPWWNHWPVAQVLSDGRYCQAADRASSFSLAWASPRPHEGENNTYWWAWMYGATQDKASLLVGLAKSWTMAPALVIHSGGSSGEYDVTQRCYVIDRVKKESAEPLRFTLKADPEHPVCNPAFVVNNWGHDNAELKLNGKTIPKGESFRYGHVRKVNDYNLVVWIKYQSDEPVELSLSKKN